MFCWLTNRIQHHLREKKYIYILKSYNQTQNYLYLCFSLLLPLYGDECCYRTASTGSELQTTLCTGSQGYKTNNRGLHVCICVCLRPVLWLMDNSREEGVGGSIGEGGSESVRIAWWRTDPAVMAGYKLSYYIIEAWSAGAARPRPAKANHQHSGKQPAHTSLPGAASQTSYRNLRNLMSTWPRTVDNVFRCMCIVLGTCSSFPVLLLVSWVKCD